MSRRELTPINAGSMADIAFLLLIFFLVTTTMDVDTGLMRQLPQIQDEEEQDKDEKIKERNVFVVLVNQYDDLLVEGKPMDIHNLRDAAKEFIANPNNEPDLPVKVEKEIPYFGKVFITKGPVISLQNDRGTTYGMYIRVQNELMAAKEELRNDLSTQYFGMKYDDLDESRQDAIKKYYSSALSEAEPKALGGK